MEIYEAINTRRTVRDFTERPIEPATLKRILSAGLHAPSNNHLREWEFIVVDQMSTRLIRYLKALPKKKWQIGSIVGERLMHANGPCISTAFRSNTECF